MPMTCECCEKEMQSQPMKSDTPLRDVFSTLPRCANGMKGGGPPAASE